MCISATHTHSGPGGYFQYLLYEVTSEGFVNSTLNALVDGKANESEYYKLGITCMYLLSIIIIRVTFVCIVTRILLHVHVSK